VASRFDALSQETDRISISDFRIRISELLFSMKKRIDESKSLIISHSSGTFEGEVWSLADYSINSIPTFQAKVGIFFC
jgi:hypothetical protein